VRFALTRFLLGAVALALAVTAHANDYPQKPIRIVSPFTAGGANDIFARILAQKLTERWGQTVLVDNRPGAGGTLGADLVAKAAPDGYTLLMVALAHAAHESLYAKLPYNIEKDFAPVSLVAVTPLVLLVNASTPVTTVKEFIAWAKSKPGQLNYGSGGNGTSQHLAMEMFKSMAGVDLMHVPYKGIPQTYPDLMGGQIAAIFSPIASALPLIQSGKLKALAVTSPKRSPVVADLPTIAEAGVANYAADTWHGVLAPAATPAAIVAKLNAEIVKILNTPEIRESLAKQGADPAPMTPDQFRAYIKAEVMKYAKVVKQSGARLD
jgi:tripartite-type tricarboxylate transporter receptor subunit TctC